MIKMGDFAAPGNLSWLQIAPIILQFYVVLDLGRPGVELDGVELDGVELDVVELDVNELDVDVEWYVEQCQNELLVY